MKSSGLDKIALACGIAAHVAWIAAAVLCFLSAMTGTDYGSLLTSLVVGQFGFAIVAVLIAIDEEKRHGKQLITTVAKICGLVALAIAALVVLACLFYFIYLCFIAYLLMGWEF